MTQRLELVEEILLGGATVTDICDRKNISTKTAYKWLNRYKVEGPNGLKNQSRARHTQHQKTSADIEAMFVEAHDKFPYWGPRKLRNYLINQGSKEKLPSAPVISEILKRHGREVIKNNKSKPAKIRFEKESPNELWQMDFKGSFMLDTGRCYPLTILDDHSRYSIALQACQNERRATVKNHLISAFKRYGLPQQINVDNGNPWGNSDLESHTALTIWLIKLGIRLTHSAPFHPQTNGKDERFHRTLKLEVLHDRKYKNQKVMQKYFDEWQHEYNFMRPHDALNGQPPASCYSPSLREYSDTPREFSYDPGENVRKVESRNGYVKFRGKRYRTSKALAGEHVAIKETADSKVFSIFFMDTFIKKIKVCD